MLDVNLRCIIDYMNKGKLSLAQLKLHSRAYYNRIGKIYCPILEEDVYFTAEGYFHLINESNSKPGKTNPRITTEQYMKLMCLQHVPTVLKYSTLVVERRKNRKKVKGKWKDVIQTEIVHEFKGEKISVIVEKVGNGNTKFLSVFPAGKNKHSSKNTP